MGVKKEIKLKEVLNRSICRKKGFFDTVGLSEKKGKDYDLSIVLKELIKQASFSMGEKDVYDFLNENIDVSLFLSEKHKREEIEFLTVCVKRYFDYLLSSGIKSTISGYSNNIELEDFSIPVSSDFIVDYGKYVEIIKIKKGAPKLSYSGRSSDTRPSGDIELFLLYLLGKTAFPTKEVIASFHHLKSKDDNPDEIIPEYEIKRGKNIVSNNFKGKETYMEKKILELLKEDLSLNSSMTSKEKDCENCPYQNMCKYENTIQTLSEIKEVVKKGELKLTPDQLEAINTQEGILRINAGAGSGKTTIVALRVAQLIQDGADPESILLITFTNNGATEMKERVAYWLKDFGIDETLSKKIDIMTFNSWGSMVLSKMYPKLGYTKEPMLADKVQLYDIILKILDTHPKLENSNYRHPLINYLNAKGVVIEVLDYFNFIKSRFNPTEDDLQKEYKISEVKAEIIFKMYKSFNEELLRNNLIEYQDQLNSVVNIFDEYYEEMEKEFSYAHIIVDEYQDTNNLQMDIVTSLASFDKMKSLMVVGDDSQAIFSFRQATPENMLYFHKYFNETKDIYLVDNFRSTPEIIGLANTLNDLNTKKINKTLRSGLKSGKAPELVALDTLKMEYEHIANEVVKHIKNGTEPQNIAIIARTKSELVKISEELLQRNVPYILNSPDPIYKNKSLNALISFSEFFLNTDYDLGLLEYLFILKKDQMEKMTEDEIRGFVNKYKAGFISKLSTKETEEDKLNFFYEIAASLFQKEEGLERFFCSVKEKGFVTITSLFEYLSKVVEYQDDSASYSYKEDDKEDEEAKYKAVTLITAHSSKGSEFEKVFLTLNKFNYSSELSVLEEERRLLFVGITRAKKELYLSYQMNRDKKKPKVPYNQFVNDLKSVKQKQAV